MPPSLGIDLMERRHSGLPEVDDAKKRLAGLRGE